MINHWAMPSDVGSIMLDPASHAPADSGWSGVVIQMHGRAKANGLVRAVGQ